MSTELTIDSVSLSYAGRTVLDTISFSVETGKIACIIGPSGCGKTSLLRSIAGFETPSAGKITLAGKTLHSSHTKLAPEQRTLGMVFQDFALFPHLTIEKNIAFGLRKHNQKHSQKHIDARVTDLAERIGIKALLKRYPHEISGGQQQRVALARAIAPSPKLLLMDEPFSNMDPELKTKLVHEIRKIIKDENITALVVTHDQLEAFALADELGVIHNGTLQQWDTPYNLYHKPKNIFISSFIGMGNFIPCTVLDASSIDCALGILRGKIQGEGLKNGDKAQLFLRPDDVIHDDDSPLTVEITQKYFRGADFLYTLKVRDELSIQCFAPSHHNHSMGEKIGIKLDTKHLVVFPTTHKAD